jgi:hypothetical protein
MHLHISAFYCAVCFAVFPLTVWALMPVAPAADLPNKGRHILLPSTLYLLTTYIFLQLSTLFRERVIYA